MNDKGKPHLGRFVDRFNEIEKMIKDEEKPIESEPSEVIDIGEKYQLVTGVDEDEAGGLDSRLLPNLHKKWMPSETIQGPYNSKLYKSSGEQEFYEGFIQPLFNAYRTGKYRHGMAAKEGIQTHNWEKRVNLDALGPEKALFVKDDGRTHALLGEIEIVLILAVHVMDDLTRYGIAKVARRIGCSIKWVRDFRKKVQQAYGKMAIKSVEDHLETQMSRCEGILDTFMTKARDGDPYAAKIVKDFMDKEDQYIMPTLEQMPAKETEEKRNEAMERLEKIFERKKIGDNHKE